MVAYASSQGLTGSIPVVGAALAGLATVAVVTLTPGAVLEDWVLSSGIAALIPAAAPPLGVTARAVLSIAGGGAAAAVAWAALYLLWGTGGYLSRRPSRADAPSVRRADAHPDAPPRRPMSAADLGTPLMDVVARNEPTPEPLPAPTVMEAIAPAGRALPTDLDTPLASFAAVPNSPPLAPGERIETFELTPVVRRGSQVPKPEAKSPEPASPPSLEQLIRRLEQGAQRRAAHG